MQQKISLQLKPNEASDEAIIISYIASHLYINENKITGFYILKQSIDARSRKQIWINLTLQVFIDEPFIARKIAHIEYKNLPQNAKEVIVIGAGPAGLFAALKLIELGIKPIIVERGKDVRERRRDLAKLNKEGVVNPDSNYCFGEGGAGTYSDGKLYTRSNKRGSIDNILNSFVQFGAEEKILYQSHPHIGTNKLPHIIAAMRNKIIECGGEVHFNTKVTDFIIKNDKAESIETSNGNSFKASNIILATGHSARDIFELLHKKDILIEAKPFALGVRIEHPQAIIDECQYSSLTPTQPPLTPPKEGNTTRVKRSEFLPPASYGLVEQVDGKGVFSFCMCPGGIIAAAATDANEIVVNGWSPSKRNNPYANSGMVVSVEVEDALKEFKVQSLKFKVEDTPKELGMGNGELVLLAFQKMVEQQAYKMGGGNLVAPAQRVVDFCEHKISSSLPSCSYIPGITSVSMQNVLPKFIHERLQNGIKAFGKRMKGYYTNEAIVVATESRTSSPVRIPRDNETLQHPQIKNLYPCGEGAGYAGGIVSAAMDGERIAMVVAASIS